MEDIGRWIIWHNTYTRLCRHARTQTHVCSYARKHTQSTILNSTRHNLQFKSLTWRIGSFILPLDSSSTVNQSSNHRGDIVCFKYFLWVRGVIIRSEMHKWRGWNLLLLHFYTFVFQCSVVKKLPMYCCFSSETSVENLKFMYMQCVRRGIHYDILYVCVCACACVQNKWLHCSAAY